MKFNLQSSIDILERTPLILKSYLSNLSNDWLKNNEGNETWSPYDVVGHLIVGEKTDWIVRIKIILNDSEDKNFKPFDRFAQLNADQNIPISELLDRFSSLRGDNIKTLKALNVTDQDIKLTGIHPEFGVVTLEELISTWTVHDLGHIAQISRIMAKQYISNVGPWINYLGILK